MKTTFSSLSWFWLALVPFGATTAFPAKLRSLNTEGTQEVDQDMIDRAIAKNQEYGPLKFAYLSPEAANDAVEDDIRKDLEALGFSIETVKLGKSDLNDLRQGGDFHLTITETWGTPYDPFTTANSWLDDAGGEGFHPAFANFTEGNSREELYELIADALQLEDPIELKQAWLDIHRYYHSQAVLLPLWGKRIPTVINKRFTKWEAGFQQFDYPLWKLEILDGPDTVTIAPGARTGLFKTIGPLDAHTYGPNEFFTSNWVYEGLVAYGAGGDTVPALAESWDIAENTIGGYTYTFQLRQNVTFHDGEAWNCNAAKLNFDHLFAGALRNRHGWYGVFTFTEDWSCNNDFEFVIRTNTKHGPYLQELALIRPVRMISPGAFPDNAHPLDANACSLNWGEVDGKDVLENVTCVGQQGPYGTGPFKFKSRDTVDFTNDEGKPDSYDNEVVFEANNDYWDGDVAIQTLVIKRYENEESVKAALLDQSLDMVWGAGVLSDASIVSIRDSAEYSKFLNVFHGQDIQNVLMLLNSGMPPLDDINVRKTIIHAINKAAFVENELRGLQETVDNVFPKLAPYCDVTLTPRWDYDFEKAVLLTLEDELGNDSDSDDNKALAIGLGVGLGVGLLLVCAFAFYYYNRSNQLQEELELKMKEGGAKA